ncbi:MAG: outer membrane protein assembly factor BamA, partial [Candidatus Omnitrophica bacterium]|nr:outer membrane protein assembly factor BamA [Candidatus Omnitrophota bacterium]
AISTNTVISKMKTRIGSPYQESVISDDLKRLYLLGFFSDIKIDTEDYKDGVKVIVIVRERAIISSISFTGFRRLTIRTFERGSTKRHGLTAAKTIKTQEGAYVDYPTLGEDVETLKGWYEKRGYTYAEVDFEVTTDPATNKASVTFVAREGTRARIVDIFVKGNTAYSARRILRLMKTRKAWLFNRGVLKDEVLDEDVERIKAFYQKEGYADVAVSSEVSTYAEGSAMIYVTMTIVEGKRYLVGDIRIEGNSVIDEESLRKQLTKAPPGSVYSRESVKEDKAAMQGLYFDRGYISARVEDTTSVNLQSGAVDISYGIFEGEPAYVNKIRIRGNVKTMDLVIRRELRIYPGDRFDGTKLKRSRERLHNLGYFEEIDYSTEDTDVPDRKDLIVDVKESKTGAFSFGGGYSTVDDFIGFVEVQQKNFDWRNFPYFTGAGQDLRVRASVGTVSQGFDISFTEPWMFDYPVSFGFDAYKRQRERESDLGFGYDEDITGGALRLGKEISEYLRGSIRYRYDVIDISDVTQEATVDLKREEGKNHISSITPGLSYDSRDSIFNPRTGDYVTGSLEWAGGPLGGDKDFWKLWMRASHFFPLPRQSAFEARLRLGLVDSYGDSERVPIYERFFAGGAYTVRGYDERSLGPIDAASEDPLGGQSVLVANLEYVYPLLDFIKVAFFYDAGNVWGKMNDVGSGGFKSSVGLGVRINTPIGPVRLDYGIPLDKAPGEEERGNGRFHFSASHGF